MNAETDYGGGVKILTPSERECDFREEERGREERSVQAVDLLPRLLVEDIHAREEVPGRAEEKDLEYSLPESMNLT